MNLKEADSFDGVGHNIMNLKEADSFDGLSHANPRTVRALDDCFVLKGTVRDPTQERVLPHSWREHDTLDDGIHGEAFLGIVDGHVGKGVAVVGGVGVAVKVVGYTFSMGDDASNALAVPTHLATDLVGAEGLGLNVNSHQNRKWACVTNGRTATVSLLHY
ncbi:hypothetical protein BGZ58_004698, partial [Dissophora ornata]